MGLLLRVFVFGQSFLRGLLLMGFRSRPKVRTEFYSLGFSSSALDLQQKQRRPQREGGEAELWTQPQKPCDPWNLFIARPRLINIKAMQNLSALNL